MRILVTGGAGFIGSRLCDVLRYIGHNLVIVDNFSTGKESNLGNISGAMLHRVDIVDDKKVDRVLSDSKIDAIVHLAAQPAITTSWSDPALDLRVNGVGTINLLRSALKYGVKRFIFSSTSAVYAEKERHEPSGYRQIPLLENDTVGPSSPYGISKLAAEGYVRTLFPESVILRFGNVYGPRQVSIGGNQVIPLMIRHLEFGDEFYIHGSGNQKRDFIYVDDIVDAIVKSLGGESGTYNIGTGSSVSVNQIGFILQDMCGSSLQDMCGSKDFEWKHTGQEDPRPYVCLDNSLAKFGLDWEPKVDIADGLSRTVDWFKETQTK